MSGEAWLFLLAVLVNAVNLFLQVFFTIMYSDLEWYVSCLKLQSKGRKMTNLLPATTSTPSISATASTPTSSLRLVSTLSCLSCSLSTDTGSL